MQWEIRPSMNDRNQQVQWHRDIAEMIEEAAVEVAADQGLNMEELQDLHLYASTRNAARVFARAIELRKRATEGQCQSTTSRSS